MNKNQIKGEVKDLVGKAQEQVGKWVGSPEQQALGIQKQVEGTTEKLLGDAQQAIKSVVDKA